MDAAKTGTRGKMKKGNRLVGCAFHELKWMLSKEHNRLLRRKKVFTAIPVLFTDCHWT